MAFASDAQRRWFFAHLATGMRRIAGKMREAYASKGKASGEDKSIMAQEREGERSSQSQRFSRAVQNVEAPGGHRIVVEREGDRFVGSVWSDQGRQRLFSKTYTSERAALRGASEFQYGKKVAKLVFSTPRRISKG